MTEDEVQKLVKEKFDEYAREYFAMRRPGFNIESGFKTLGHDIAEFCVSTDSGQGLHFYQPGNAKMLSNKSVEIYSGRGQTDDEAMTIVLDAKNGCIKITAPNGDLILQGRNVKIEALDADGDVSINSKKTVTVDAPEFNADVTKCTLAATSDMLLTAGTLDLYSETGAVITSSGQDPILGPSIVDSIINVADKARKLGRFIK